MTDAMTRRTFAGSIGAALAAGGATQAAAAAIAIDADHPRAKIIPDVFHMHITHSGFKGIRHLRGDFFDIFPCFGALASSVTIDSEGSIR